jgi:hypothetical protein
MDRKFRMCVRYFIMVVAFSKQPVKPDPRPKTALLKTHTLYEHILNYIIIINIMRLYSVCVCVCFCVSG